MRLKLCGGRNNSTSNLSVFFPNVGAVPENSRATPGKFTFICHIKRVFLFILFYFILFFLPRIKERLMKLKGPKEGLRGRLNKVFGFGCLGHAVGR